MSISPPSDIILGVANAADPQAYRAAAARLLAARTASAGETQTAASSKVASADDSVPTKFTVPQPPASQATPAASQQQQPASTTSSREANAYQQFEAYLLQTFVESMLPKEAADVYGSGTAGDIWKSMFAEQIAGEMARTTSFGIADSIARHRAKIDKAASRNGTQSAAQAVTAGALAERSPYQQSALGVDTQAFGKGSATSIFSDRRGS